MISGTHLAAFAAASFVLIVIPGPSVLFVIGRALALGRRAALASVIGPFTSRADAGRALVRALAIAAQGIEDADQPAMPHWRTPPVLADLAVGDQVRVLGHDFLTSLPGAAKVVWTPAGRVPRAELVRDVEATVAEVAGFL